MKILRLRLKNFAHIYSGLSKDEIVLDFSKSHKVINIIIGKMGSCKTVILGHLQPFASLGTLDSRNQDEIVMEGKDGIKEIDIQDGENIYAIRHEYRWVKNHHSVKSFIKKNGNELNPSGSVTAFKDLVEIELDIEPGMLTLLRLGPNVSNLIDLKSTSRKAFLASMLEETDIYVRLYKNLNDDLRNVRAQIDILSGRLAKSADGDIESIRQKRDRLNETVASLQKKVEHYQRKVMGYVATFNSLIRHSDIRKFEKDMEDLQNQIISDRTEYDVLVKRVEWLKNAPSTDDLIKNVQHYTSLLAKNSQRYIQLENDTETLQTRIDELKGQMMQSRDRDQLNLLRAEFERVKAQHEDFSKRAKKIPYRYDSPALKRLLGQLNTANILISEIVNYNELTVQDILAHSERAVHTSSKKMGVVNATKLKTQKRLNNVRYLERYEEVDPLGEIPDCQFLDTCPYRLTHPITVKQEIEKKGVDKEYEEINKTVKKLDEELGRLSEYPIVYSKISTLSSIWKSVSPILMAIGALKVKKFPEIFKRLDSQIWYDHNRLINAIDAAESKEKADQIQLSMEGMRAQIAKLESSDFEKVQAEYKEATARMEQMVLEYKSLADSKESYEQQLNDANAELSRRMSDLDINTRIENLSRKIQEETKQYETMKRDLKDAEQCRANGDLCEQKRLDAKRQLEVAMEEAQSLSNTIAIYNATSEELRHCQETQNKLRLIVEAVSSSKGIPLVYIQLFMRSCRSILNHLISNVFGDQIEVAPFVITEDEFRIPYSINGTAVDDIAKASQGQRAIISLALSFALMQQASARYNVMLLDEMDGPLYQADRQKFIDILFKQISAINAEQIFVVSHNNTFDGHSVNVIMTTEENVEDTGAVTVMRV